MCSENFDDTCHETIDDTDGIENTNVAATLIVAVLVILSENMVKIITGMQWTWLQIHC